MLQITPKPRPKLQIRTRQESAAADVTTSFDSLVRKAIAVTSDLNRMTSHHAGRLTADALFREALALARTSPDRVASLRADLESDTPGLHHSRASLKRMLQFLRSPNWAAPPKDARRLSFLTNEATNSELALSRNSFMDLFCVAVQIATERHPDCFGTCDDSARFERKLADLRVQQRELFDKVVGSITADDLDIGPVDAQGRAKVSFRLSGGNVPIAPQDNAGERLVNYLLANASKDKA